MTTQTSVKIKVLVLSEKQTTGDDGEVTLESACISTLTEDLLDIAHDKDDFVYATGVIINAVLDDELKRNNLKLVPQLEDSNDGS